MNEMKRNIENVCCVVVTYNGTLETINTLLEYEKLFSILVIVDNSTSMEFRQLLSENINHAHLIFNCKNEGIAKALNQGVAYAKEKKARFLLTMDQDSIITKDIIIELLNAIDEKAGYISVGPAYQESSSKNYIDVSFLITSGNLVLTDAIEEVGGYSEELFIDEVDIDFSWALIKAGYKLRQVANVNMHHKIGEYERSNILGIRYLSHSPIRFYYIYRNSVLVFKKYYKVFGVKCLKMLLALILIDTRQLLFIENNKKAKIHMACKGLIDGMRNINGEYRQI